MAENRSTAESMPGNWNVAWVTGASSGLGEHGARELAQRGVTVCISARSADKLDAIAATHPSIHAYPCDVTDPDELKEVAARIAADHGAIDLALMCAGAWFQASITDLRLDNIARTFNVNVQGVFNVLDAVLPDMVARGAGHVAWISSVAGYGGLPMSAAYGPSKAALINLAEGVKPELARKGITVSLINPGFVKTPMTAKNEFDMPFLMEVEPAAKSMIDQLATGRFEVRFPWQLVWILKFLNILPYPLYFAATQRLLK